MKPKQALAYFGTQTEMARRLGCAQSSISEWFDNDRIPDGRQYQIQIATVGKLKADKPALRKRGK